jgi:hypothetical protein
MARHPRKKSAANPQQPRLPVCRQFVYAAVRQDYCHLPNQQAKGTLAQKTRTFTAITLGQGKLW